MPTDPDILLSYVNTKLRDEYGSLEDLCGSLGFDRAEVCRILEGAGFRYDEERNAFI